MADLPGDELSCKFACSAIRGEHLRDGRWRTAGGEREHLFDCTWDAQKRQLPGQEGLDRDLVGGVQGDAVVLRGGCSLIGEAQAGETGEVRRLEINWPRAAKSKFRSDSTRSG